MRVVPVVLITTPREGADDDDDDDDGDDIIIIVSCDPAARGSWHYRGERVHDSWLANTLPLRCHICSTLGYEKKTSVSESNPYAFHVKR